MTYFLLRRYINEMVKKKIMYQLALYVLNYIKNYDAQIDLKLKEILQLKIFGNYEHI